MYRRLTSIVMGIVLSMAEVAMQLAIAALPCRTAFVTESVPAAATVSVKESVRLA